MTMRTCFRGTLIPRFKSLQPTRQFQSITPRSTTKSWLLNARQMLQQSPIGRLASSYARIQARKPYTTQVCSILVIWLCGDLSAQLLFPSEVKGHEHGSAQACAPTYDPWRTVRHLTVGVVASIPTYKWFMLLQRSFNFESKVASILTRVVVQQLVYTPVFNTYFFSMQSLLSGASLQDTLERLGLTLPTSIVNGWKVWTGVALVSFTVVPAQFRSVFSGCVAVCWQSYLSWMNQAAAVVVRTGHEA